MTNEEAIKLLNPLFEECKGQGGCLGYIEHFVTRKEEEAMELAIKALEQEPCETIKEIPKDYKYDTETEDFLVYRHKYTGHEIHIEKPVPRYRLEQPCEDCISREETIENFASWYGYDYNNQGYYRLLKQMPSVTPQPKLGEWILCDNQLPPKDKNVLVTRMYKGKPYVEIAEWNDGWTSYSDEYKVDYFTEHQVIAWMPLPSPYKAESED